MKMARKLLAATMMSAVAGTAGASALAQFGGMPAPAVTPQHQNSNNNNSGQQQTQERKLPAYVVVDRGGPNSTIGSSQPGVARYTSINEAIKNVAWGGAVIVMPGTYNENIKLERSVSLEGRDGVRIVQTAAADGTQPSCLTFTPNNYNEHVRVSNIDFVPAANTTAPCIDVKGGIFTMVDSSVDGNGSHGGTLVSIAGGMAYLEKNNITGGRVGISVAQEFSAWDRVSLVDNIVTENYHEGIHLGGNATMLATGNLINDNGIGLTYNGQGMATLVGNKILNNGSHGMVLGAQGKEVLVRLNQIWSNDQDGIKVENSAGLIEDNDIDGNGGVEISTIGHLNTVPTIINDVAQNTASPNYNSRRNNRRGNEQTQWRVGNGPRSNQN